MTDDRRVERLIELIRAEQVDNLDIAGVPPEDVASVAQRRWGSYARRHRKTPSFDERVIDLAKGLRDAYDPDVELGGSPNMIEWAYFAETIAPLLDASDD